jgi:hypothetical protein
VLLKSKLDHGSLVEADLDTFWTAIYVRLDNAIRTRPELRQGRRGSGTPRISLTPSR